MKKIISLIAIIVLFSALAVAVQAATTSSNLNITATVPTLCGNGVINGTEACDNGASNGACPASCSASCTQNSCGGGSWIEIGGISAVGRCQTASTTWQVTLFPAGLAVQSTGYIRYWPTANPASTTQIAVTANNPHSVGLAGLSPFTDYSYFIYAVYGSYTTNATGTFYTDCGTTNVGLDVQAREKGTRLLLTYPNSTDIAGLIIYNGSQTSCSLADAAAKFYSSTSSKAGGSSETIPGHSNTVLGQVYGYTACVYNSHGVYSPGVYDWAMRTVSGAVSPGAVAGDGEITLSWTNPANNLENDFAFSQYKLIRVINCSATTGESLREEAGAGAGKDQSFKYSGLTNGQTYYYKLFIKNTYGEYSSGQCLTATPTTVSATTTEPRCPSSISSPLVENTVNFTWTNPVNEEPVFRLEKIDWRRSAGIIQNKNEGSQVFSDIGTSFSDSGLTPGQSYYYTVFVTYSNGKTANCGYTIVTVPKEEEICPGCEIYDVSPQFSYFVNDGALEIVPDSQNTLWSLPSQNLNIRALAGSLPKPAEKMIARFNGADYLMVIDGSGIYYQTSFDLPAAIGKYPLDLITVYTDQTYASKQLTVEILPYGRVISSLGRELPDTDVSLYLYKDGVLFSGYGVRNPVRSVARGAYGFMVPDGRYTLVAVKDNYKESRQDIEVNNNVINRNIFLTPVDLLAALEDLIGNPLVQEANRNIGLPLALAIALINLLVAVPFWGLIHFLQFLFTEPWWLLAWRKRKDWGVVYNSITKVPVDLAVVRLYDANTKKLLQSRVTDRAGRYIFLVGEGQYYLEATNPKFEYPSKIMANVSEDSKYADIYHGETITIKEGGRGIIVANIPMDQKGLAASNEQIMREISRQKLSQGIALIGPILAIICFAIMPGWLTGLLLIAHLLLYLLFRRLALKRRSKGWGVIYDIKDKKPLDKAIARIYSPEYGRMLDYYVTDKYGRYGFLAGHNTYYLTAEKPGFATRKTDNIDLKGKEGDKVVGLDINLQTTVEKPTS